MAFFRRYATSAFVLCGICVLVGCSKPAPEATPAPAAPPYHPVASIREVMNSVIDPNVDVVWNAVKTDIDHGKQIEHAPTNEEEWAAVRHSALTVMEGANLLMMPGRAVAPPGAGSLSPGIELAPDQVRALIDKSPSGWNQFARSLQDSVQPALAAIDKKDPQALFEAGDKIDEVCESCHQVFWYPAPAAGTSASAR
ncbi:MAG TPA: hypothetical protein VN654_08110 [Vicinamibacterales bacterium]|jgi:hypothetical protein|nr:hypothetical protein [Vicinamibacterales bacterium]